MDKFMKWMEEHFVPVAAKIGAQRHLVAIRDGFVTIMPLIIVGSFAVLINGIDIFGYQDMMTSIFGDSWKSFGGNIWNATFGIMSILIVCTISYHLARGYDKDGIAAAVVSFASFIVLDPQVAFEKTMAYKVDEFGAQGLFVAIFVALIATEIFVKLVGNPKLVVKMPDGVPPAVAKSFAALIPSIIVIVIFTILRHIFNGLDANIFTIVADLIQKPLTGVVGSLGGMIALIIIQQLIWFFGLHGANVLAPVINATLLPLLMENTAAVQEGLNPEHIINSQFIDSYINMGGSGTTLALLIAIFIAGRKSKQQTSIAKLAIAPGCFNINEPIIYGMPLVLNPIYLVPFILAPLASGIIAYTLTAIGFVPKVYLAVSWTMPPIFGAILSTNSIRGGLVSAICLVVAVLIYLPFVRMATRRELEVEGL